MQQMPKWPNLAQHAQMQHAQQAQYAQLAMMQQSMAAAAAAAGGRHPEASGSQAQRQYPADSAMQMGHGLSPAMLQSLNTRAMPDTGAVRIV